MKANLNDALAHIFSSEGGFAQRATEPGGSVNMGVSQQALATWNKAHGEPAPTVDDVRNLPKWKATEIYVQNYAAPINFDALPAGLDYCVLDAAVNEGVGAALRLLAAAVGLRYNGARPPLDPLVHAATKAAVGPVIDAICDARLAGKRQRPEWHKFGIGWTARIESVRAHAKAMARVI